MARLDQSGRMEEILREILAGHTDPYSACEDLIAEILGGT
jgi:hypothetical protein